MEREAVKTMALPDEFETQAESINDLQDPSEKSYSEFNKRLLEISWHEDEERRLVRRLDFYLIPLAMVMFFTLNLDR